MGQKLKQTIVRTQHAAIRANTLRQRQAAAAGGTAQSASPQSSPAKRATILGSGGAR